MIFEKMRLQTSIRSAFEIKIRFLKKELKTKFLESKAKNRSQVAYFFFQCPKRISSLKELLDKFLFFTPIISGHAKAIEDAGYDFVKRQYENQVFYTEVRYGPQLMRTDFIKKEDVLTSAQVVEAVNAGLERGTFQLCITVRSLSQEYNYLSSVGSAHLFTVELFCFDGWQMRV